MCEERPSYLSVSAGEARGGQRRVGAVKDEGSKARERVELAKHLSCKHGTRVFNSESTLIKTKVRDEQMA